MSLQITSNCKARFVTNNQTGGANIMSEENEGKINPITSDEMGGLK